IATLRINPFFGTGFGHEFAEPVSTDNVSLAFQEFRYLPHNSVLGLWSFTGVFGFTALFLPLVVGLFFGARSSRWARRAGERTAALAAVAAIVAYVIHCWGDIGFSERLSIWLVAPALAVAGQLATTTGAWRNRIDPATRIRIGAS